MNFSNHTFLTNSLYGSTFTTLTLFISKSCKNKERSAKTRFEFVEMHTNQLDPHLIGIINRSRMSPKPATNSHMTGAPKLETVAVHCGKNSVECRRPFLATFDRVY